jgi:hypothetical protein
MLAYIQPNLMKILRLSDVLFENSNLFNDSFVHITHAQRTECASLFYQIRPIAMDQYFFLVKVPAADATDAPQP